MGKRKFGRVYNIGKVDYKREVTDASNEELPGEPEGWGTGVVCVLFKDRCVRLRRVASLPSFAIVAE